jgi:hypothetical protein
VVDRQSKRLSPLKMKEPLRVFLDEQDWFLLYRKRDEKRELYLAYGV